MFLLGGCALQEGIRNQTEPNRPNRTGRSEPNGTELFNSGTGRNRTRKRTEPNRTEPRRVPKTQAESRRTRNDHFPNRTESNRLIFEKNPEPKRIEPNGFLPGISKSDQARCFTDPYAQSAY